MDKKTVPFFARKLEVTELVVKTGVRAGASEARMKLTEQRTKGQ